MSEDLRGKGWAVLIEEGWKQGDGAALLHIFQWCADENEPIPEWARLALSEILAAVYEGKLESWDDVFGKPYPKGEQRRGVQTASKRWQIHNRVRDLHEKEGMPIDNALFESVGREFGVGRSTAGKLYGEVEQIMFPVRQALWRTDHVPRKKT